VLFRSSHNPTRCKITLFIYCTHLSQYKFYNDGLSFNAQIRIIYTHTETEAVKKNISLTTKGDIPKNSAIPPQIPYKTLSVDDFLSLFCIVIPLSLFH